MTQVDPGKEGDPFATPMSRPAPLSVSQPSRSVFDGAFVGPIVPPPPPGSGAPGQPSPPPGMPPPPPPVTPRPVTLPPAPEAILALPLGTGRLVAMSLDLLTRPDAGLRAASFYIGFLLLVSAAPAAALVTVAYLALGDAAFAPGRSSGLWASWTVIAAIPAIIGYIVVSIESRTLATAVIGGRAEGRPLRLRESIAIARRRFWPVFWGQMVAGFVGLVGGAVASAIADGIVGPVSDIDLGVQLVTGLLVGAPFVYVTAGLVLGEVGLLEAISRSFRLFAARKRLALAVSVFGALSQFIVLFGIGIGLDSAERLGVAAGILDSVPEPLAVPVIAALVFAFGTLTFIVAEIAAAPAVYAFAALTHYTHGLELGRREPARVRRPWDPWLTRGMALGAIVALASLVLGVLGLPG